MADILHGGPSEAAPTPAEWGPPMPPPPPEQQAPHVESESWNFRRVISMIGVILLGAVGWGAMVDQSSVAFTAGTRRLDTQVLGVIGLVIFVGWSVLTSMLFARREEPRAWRLVGVAWSIFLVFAVVAVIAGFNDNADEKDSQDLDASEAVSAAENEPQDGINEVVREADAGGVDLAELALEDHNDGRITDLELDGARVIMRYGAHTIPGLEDFDETAWSDAEIRLITSEACAVAAQATDILDFDQRLQQIWPADTVDVFAQKSMVAGAGMNYACDDDLDRVVQAPVQP